MRLDEIAIGATYQLQAREVGNPTVQVEAIAWHHQGPYDRLAAVLARPTYQGGRLHALVYVYEAARNTRYPCDPAELQRLTPQTAPKRTTTHRGA